MRSRSKQHPASIADLIPVGEATEIDPVYIGDPERDGIDINDLETALADLEEA